ncbi:hypothetical protein AAVH_34958 [Aphelenchoides avenae]|nr:hypothetical protein AAVH_34958 [Aphelenchus avenae]
MRDTEYLHMRTADDLLATEEADNRKLEEESDCDDLSIINDRTLTEISSSGSKISEITLGDEPVDDYENTPAVKPRRAVIESDTSSKEQDASATPSTDDDRTDVSTEPFTVEVSKSEVEVVGSSAVGLASLSDHEKELTNFE